VVEQSRPVRRVGETGRPDRRARVRERDCWVGHAGVDSRANG
jgi:hypothetical protein